MKFRFLKHVLLPGLLLCLLACSNNNSTVVNGGAGLLFVTAQANTTISVYSVNLSTGQLSQNGNSVGTGAAPSAIAITPAIDAIFVANSGSNTISSYSITSGSLAAASGTAKTGSIPMGLAIDPGGKFLFVANQGSSNVSVFSISGTGLTAVAGSPFTTVPAGLSYPNGTLPTALAVSNSGKFLYVASQLADFVSAFSINSTSGALTPLGVPFYNVGASPSGLGISPNGGFLYVANAGSASDNISVFSICDNVINSCSNPNSPDGTLKEIAGSPFPAGLGPVAIAFDLNFNFAYVVDEGSNTVSQYSYGTGDGVLTPLSPATISTGTTPVSIAVRVGATGTNIGNTTTNPTDYVYVANNGSGSISTYTLTTSTGILNVFGMPIITFGQTSALAAR